MQCALKHTRNVQEFYHFSIRGKIYSSMYWIANSTRSHGPIKYACYLLANLTGPLDLAGLVTSVKQLLITFNFFV